MASPDAGATGQAAIVGLGLATAVGCSAGAACAAIRAGLARFAAGDEVRLAGDDGEARPVVVASMGGVLGGLVGRERLLRMAEIAAADLRRSAGLGGDELAGAGLYLALAPADPTAIDARAQEELGARIGERCAGGRAIAVQLFPSGHAGVIAAIAAATADLAAGRAARAIVGGVDSLLEPATLAGLHARGRVKVADRPVGLIPGEGAAFLLIEPLRAALERGAAVVAELSAPFTAIEPVTIEAGGVCAGDGLTAAARSALASTPDGGAGVGLWIADANGEPYRSEEIAYARVRAPRDPSSPIQLWHAADCIGDTGAAAGAVAVAIGARALQKRYAPTSEALVLASSDGDLRGAVILREHRVKGART